MSVTIKKKNEELESEEDLELEEEEESQDENEEEEETNEEDIDFEKLYNDERDKTDQLTNKILDISKGDVNKDKGKEKENQTAPPEVVKFIEESTFSDEDFENLTTDKRTFIEKMNALGNDMTLKAFEAVTKTLPGIVTNIAGFHINLNEMNRTFFENNPDMASMRKFVSGVTDELVRENKVNDLHGYEEILKVLPATVKARMKEMGLAAPKDEEKKTEKSGQPTPKGQRSSKGKAKGALNDFQRSLEFSKKRRNAS